jgi:hypothetical protein
LSLYERISDKNIGKQKELVFLRVLYESLDWRTNSYNFECIAPVKYEFESKNMFLIDNINYTNSKDSILNQGVDFLLYILRKTLETQISDVVNVDLNNLTDSIKGSILFSEEAKKIIRGSLDDDTLDINMGESFYDKE